MNGFTASMTSGAVQGSFLGFTVRDLARRALLAVAMLGMVQATTQVAQAQSPTSGAISKAKTFVESHKRGQFVLGYLHFGSSYGGYKYIEMRSVGENGRPRPGHFALVYEYTWDNTGWTNLAFLFDRDGDFYAVEALGTNAQFNQPFLKANLAIQILGNTMIEIFKKEMSREDLRTMQALIDNADAEGMLEFSLKLQQSLGR